MMPWALMTSSYEIDPPRLTFSLIPVSLFISFTLNYYYISKRLLLVDRPRMALFFAVNIVLAVVISLAVFLVSCFVLGESDDFKFIFFLRDFLNIIAAAVIAMTIRLNRNWIVNSQKKKEMELALREAELQNYKNRINPHFLLNTLNNIYALTAFDITKAQKAIVELGNMLSHMLYGDNEGFNSMEDEVDFLNSYIDLMEMRFSGAVSVTRDIDIGDGKEQIASMMLIVFVENAFKHGIAPSREQQSFIRIRLKAGGGTIVFRIENSNYPHKYFAEKDKKKHGLGLKIVKKRLELTYPGRYVLEQNVDKEKNTFVTNLIIYEKTNMRDN